MATLSVETGQSEGSSGEGVRFVGNPAEGHAYHARLIAERSATLDVSRSDELLYARDSRGPGLWSGRRAARAADLVTSALSSPARRGPEPRAHLAGAQGGIRIRNE